MNFLELILGHLAATTVDHWLVVDYDLYSGRRCSIQLLLLSIFSFFLVGLSVPVAVERGRGRQRLGEVLEPLVELSSHVAAYRVVYDRQAYIKEWFYTLREKSCSSRLQS